MLLTMESLTEELDVVVPQEQESCVDIVLLVNVMERCG